MKNLAGIRKRGQTHNKNCHETKQQAVVSLSQKQVQP